MNAHASLLEVRGLSVDIRQGAGALRVVNDVSLRVERGEAVGLVGESGSGKSMTAFAIMNLFPSPLAHVAGVNNLNSPSPCGRGLGGGDKAGTVAD